MSFKSLCSVFVSVFCCMVAELVFVNSYYRVLTWLLKLFHVKLEEKLSCTFFQKYLASDTLCFKRFS